MIPGFLKKKKRFDFKIYFDIPSEIKDVTALTG
jgi:hypothetical protein